MAPAPLGRESRALYAPPCARPASTCGASGAVLQSSHSSSAPLSWVALHSGTLGAGGTSGPGSGAPSLAPAISDAHRAPTGVERTRTTILLDTRFEREPDPAALCLVEDQP